MFRKDLVLNLEAIRFEQAAYFMSAYETFCKFDACRPFLNRRKPLASLEDFFEQRIPIRPFRKNIDDVILKFPGTVVALDTTASSTSLTVNRAQR